MQVLAYGDVLPDAFCRLPALPRAVTRYLAFTRTTAFYFALYTGAHLADAPLARLPLPATVHLPYAPHVRTHPTYCHNVHYIAFWTTP